MDYELKISEMTKEHARIISKWTYNDIYSFYNHCEEFVDECMDGMHFVFTSSKGELLGYLCFGKEARIPTVEKNIYDDDFLDIGLHIRPDLTGKKLGSSFLDACLEYARENYNSNRVRATIASFNERALNLCKSAGFYSDREVTHSTLKNKFTIVKRVHEGLREPYPQ